ncbi:MAG: hypothetical protein AAF446_06855, partial [Pseudomonadota bacterium]
MIEIGETYELFADSGRLEFRWRAAAGLCNKDYIAFALNNSQVFKTGRIILADGTGIAEHDTAGCRSPAFLGLAIGAVPTALKP